MIDKIKWEIGLKRVRLATEIVILSQFGWKGFPVKNESNGNGCLKEEQYR